MVEGSVVEKQELIAAKDVYRSFSNGGKDVQVLKGLDMKVNKHELVMLFGRSGSGKTTLLNLLGGLDQPTKGEILFKGVPLHNKSDNERTLIRRHDYGIIFQSYALVPLLSVEENVELSMRMAGRPRAEWEKRITYCLELVGLEKRRKHRPFELSGGEQQRVAIARAIAHKPSLLLADEPTAELDTKMSAQVLAVFKNIIQNEGISICMTTHNRDFMEEADRIYEMVDGAFVSKS